MKREFRRNGKHVFQCCTPTLNPRIPEDDGRRLDRYLYPVIYQPYTSPNFFQRALRIGSTRQISYGIRGRRSRFYLLARKKKENEVEGKAQRTNCAGLSCNPDGGLLRLCSFAMNELCWRFRFNSLSAACRAFDRQKKGGESLSLKGTGKKKVETRKSRQGLTLRPCRRTVEVCRLSIFFVSHAV